MNKFDSELFDLLSKVGDPRPGKVITYTIPEVVLLAIFGFLCGCEDWKDIEELGNLRLELLRQHLPYVNGIPKAKTIGLLISILDGKELNSLLQKIASNIIKQQTEPTEHMALDGKHIGKGMYTVSAFSANNKLSFGQSDAYTKGNELECIKEMIKMLKLKGMVVTIDSIACVREVIELITQKQGEAVIALKKNQPYLYSQVSNYFDAFGSTLERHETVEKGHGRIEHRSVKVLADLQNIPELRTWKSIKAVVEVTSVRSVKEQKDADLLVYKEQIERRYYIMTKAYSAEKSLTLIREHWAIENNLHWMLDVNYTEDSHHFLRKNAIINASTFRRIAMNLIEPIKPNKMTYKSFRRRLSRDESFLSQYIRPLINTMLCLMF